MTQTLKNFRLTVAILRTSTLKTSFTFVLMYLEEKLVCLNHYNKNDVKKYITDMQEIRNIYYRESFIYIAKLVIK